ncbi:MAG: 5-(carboxyamino)imidazole ribonucleotide mutase [Candidatus Thorarchaeota archaeon]
MTESVVAIISGSKSDNEIVEKAIGVLQEYNIPHTAVVLSAHRNPKELDQFLETTPAKVIIAIAGLAAALPGVCASKNQKVVIGVPVSSKLGGLDALLSIVQMPPGVPVATVGIDNGKNAAFLAIRILALQNDDLGRKIREKMGI